MSTPTTVPVSLDRRRTSAIGRLRTMALATALACTTSGAYASFASMSITGLSITATPAVFGTDFVFGPSDAKFQSWNLLTESNAASNSNSGFTFSWNALDRTSQTGQARATFTSQPGFDPLSGQQTPAFTTTATAPAQLGILAFASGNGFSSGGFCFWDINTPFNDDVSSCTGAGSLTFQLDYTLVSQLVGPHGPASSASASILLTGLGVGGPNGFEIDSVLALPGQSTTKSGTFTWTVDLVSGVFANFEISGDVSAQGVPEPGVLALAALGLIGVAATRRRRNEANRAAA